MQRQRIVELLTELGRRLLARGVTGELYVVGGAAIALAFDEQRSTRDIDAVFEPSAAIYEVASEMADDLDLDDGWLNDGAKLFTAGPDPDAQRALDVPGLRVGIASPRILLAMKVLAHRGGEDEQDLRLLASVLGLTTAAAVLDVATEVYGDRLEVAARFFVEQTFAD